MKVEYINPFIDSTTSVFATMLNSKLVRSNLYIKRECTAEHEISGVIGLQGSMAGTVVLRLNRPTALAAAEIMIGEPQTEVNADVKDAVGELANMVAGGAKAQLGGLNMNLTIPTVVTGTFAIEFPSQLPPICVEFQSNWGPLTIEVCLVEQHAAATA